MVAVKDIPSPLDPAINQMVLLDEHDKEEIIHMDWETMSVTDQILYYRKLYHEGKLSDYEGNVRVGRQPVSESSLAAYI